MFDLMFKYFSILQKSLLSTKKKLLSTKTLLSTKNSSQSRFCPFSKVLPPKACEVVSSFVLQAALFLTRANGDQCCVRCFLFIQFITELTEQSQKFVV